MTTTQLKKIMKSKGITNQQLVDVLGLSSRSTITHWFTRGNIPKYWQKHLEEKYNVTAKKRN
jgi:transcriptional regulator with XRE-family HTH domain